MLMVPWIKVITNPLGLGGFALFLVFSYLARIRQGAERKWLAPTAVFLALIALVGGLALDFLQVSRSQIPQVPPNAARSAPQQSNRVQQTTTGAGSQAVQGVQGDVIITVDQSSGETKTEKAPQKRAKE
jgi:hypothetical protein